MKSIKYDSKFIFLTISLLIKFSCNAQVITIEANQQFPIDISSKVSIFEDKSSKLSFEEIKSQTFIKKNNKVVIIPFSDHTFWLKFTIQNKIKGEKDWVFRWVNSLTEQLDFYIPQADGSYQIIKEGGLVFKPQNKFIENLPVANFKIHDDTEHTFFIKIKSQKGHSGILEIFTKESFIEEKFSKFKREGLFNGLFILRLFYVVLLAFFIIKDQIFQRYSILILLRSLGYWGIMGILGSTITQNPKVAMHLNIIFYFLAPAAYLLVIKSVLEFKRFPKSIYIFHQILIYATLIFSIISLFDYRWYWLKASTFLIPFNIFYGVILYVYAIIKKYQIDWAYSIPILLGAIANLYLPMRLLGMPDFPGTFLFSTICFVAEIFVFGFFIGKIIKNYEKSKAKAENELQFNLEQTTKLRELDNLKTHFFTNISHEFRTPLTLLVAPIDDLKKKYPQEGIISIMQRNIQRLQTLINQLLDISKLEAGEMKLDVQEADIPQYLDNLFASFESLAQSKKVIFNHSQSHLHQLGTIDLDKLEKIITNLLSNAFKFTPENGRISIRLDYSQNELNLKIKDSGVGIDEKRLDKIFDRFYQVDDGQPHQEGTGIGLALVKELVDLLGGKIEVNSKTGEGTIFHLILPFLPIEKLQNPVTFFERKTSVAESLIDSKSNVKTYIEPDGQSIMLIVEDNPDLRNYIASIFENHFQLLLAVDGEDGLAKAIEFVPDIVVSDLMMPKLDGLGFCEKLKNDERINHIPVIMLTAKASLADKLVGLEHGADDYLSKPFNKEELTLRVHNLVNQRQLLREKYSNQTIEVPSKIETTKEPTIDELFIQKAKAIINKHLDKSEFDVEKFADEMNLSDVQLRRKLKAIADQTTTEFVRNYRLEIAADLLKKGDSTVSEIAYKVGFESMPYFSKVFLEKYGKTPSEWK